MNLHPVRWGRRLTCAAILLTHLPAQPAVPRFTPHEITLAAAGAYANPYVDCTAEATLTAPDGHTTRVVPLFWDGGTAWKLRFAPDQPGRWTWVVRSADRGLDRQTGSFPCGASQQRGSLQPMAGAPRHFQYQNGERVWFLGDTAWALLTDRAEEHHDRSAVERYLRQRAAQGFNVVHCMLLSEAGWTNRGGPPWTDVTTERINPAYFQEADARVAFANAQGLVVGLALAWGDKGRAEPWSWGRLPDLPARRRYARYIAARYAAYNVYFLVSGEWHGEIRARGAAPAGVRDEFAAIGDALRAADAHRRLIGIHPMTAHGSTREFNAAARWMDFADYQQNYAELHDRALESRAVAKPVVNAEYAYYLRDQDGDGRVDKPHSATVDDIRHASWDLAMAGAYLITGFGSTYMGGHRHPTPFLPDDPRNAIWVEQLGRLRECFTRLDYWKLAPHDELLACAVARTGDRPARGGPGRGGATQRAPATTYWCLAEPGRSHVVYVRGTTAPVSLAAPGPFASVVRFDPRTGRSENVPSAAGAGPIRLAAPDEQDWVFVLSAGG